MVVCSHAPITRKEGVMCTHVPRGEVGCPYLSAYHRGGGLSAWRVNVQVMEWVSLRRDSSRPLTSEERARGKAISCCGFFTGTSLDSLLASSIPVVALVGAGA